MALFSTSLNTPELVCVLQGVSQKFKPHHVFLKLGILQPSPLLSFHSCPSLLNSHFLPFKPSFSNPSFLPFGYSEPTPPWLAWRKNFLNNKCPTLVETHLTGQLAKSNDRKLIFEMKQTCLYNNSLKEI